MFYKTKNSDNSILLHIPHASLVIPAEEKEYFLLDDAALEKEKLIMTDMHMDRMCENIPVNMLVSDISRLVVDMERYEDDSDEGMAQYGMGLAYINAHDGKPLRIVSEDYRAELISKYYRPYHAEMKAMCEGNVGRHGKCLILDMHSFPTAPIFCVCYPEVLPDVCIGFNGNDDPLAGFARQYFETKGYAVSMNRPFSGAIIPAGLEPSIAGDLKSLMIEINRKLYMDEKTGIINDGYYSMRESISGFISEILAIWVW